MEKDKLSELAEAGPDPTRGLQHLVLSRFADIAKARSRLRRWDEIAAAMDMPGREKAKALSSAFSKVKKGIAEKRLTPPADVPAPAPRQKPQAASDRHYPLPGETAQPVISDMDEIRAQFPK